MYLLTYMMFWSQTKLTIAVSNAIEKDCVFGMDKNGQVHVSLRLFPSQSLLGTNDFSWSHLYLRCGAQVEMLKRTPSLAFGMEVLHTHQFWFWWFLARLNGRARESVSYKIEHEKLEVHTQTLTIGIRVFFAKITLAHFRLDNDLLWLVKQCTNFNECLIIYCLLLLVI